MDTHDARIRSTYTSESTALEEPFPALAQDVDFPTSEESLTANPVQSTAPKIISFASPASPCCSARSKKGSWSSTCLSEEQATEYVEKVFLSSVLDTSISYTDSLLSYQADLHTDFATGEVVQCNDPRTYLAKTKKKKYDADNPSYHDAMTGEHAKEYQKAMCVEIKQLISQNTWTPVDRASIPATSDDGKPRPILKGTWAFKLKRLPDGSPLKFKAYCIRGDMQKEGIDYFETYTPVVQWSMVRLLLTMILSKNWVTKQVDYTNTFAQAMLNEQVYIDLPRGFTRKDKAHKVLHLIKSLYGLKQAPKTFFDKLKRGLKQRGFTASTLDPCLFIKHNMIVVVYVDDTIIAGPDANKIEKLIKDLGVADKEERETFMLHDKWSVGDFHGIHIEKCTNDNFKLSQISLIEKVIKASGMIDCNTAVTPSSSNPLGTNKSGEPCYELWEYPDKIVGILMFLATNSRPDIAHAVNQCARFTHNPKASHATAVKHIIHYLKGTQTQGMLLKPNGQLQVVDY